jgi:hypothetical protein
VTFSVLVATGVTATAGAQTQNDNTSFAVTGGSLDFSTVPAMPTLSSVTITGSAQTTYSTMTNFAVDDATGSGSGWNVTVNGLTGTGKSPIFKEYCPISTCGSDSGPGYISGGATLAADSLVINSTGATFSPSSAAPAYQCGSGCDVDNSSAVKIVSASTDNGMGTFTTSGWSGTSLALSTPSNLAVLQSSEVYRVDLVWTLTSGP